MLLPHKDRQSKAFTHSLTTRILLPYEPEPFESRPSARFTNRSHGFLLAYDLFHLIEESAHSSTLESYQIYSKIIITFERWLKTYENSHIKLVNHREKKVLLIK